MEEPRKRTTAVIFITTHGTIPVEKTKEGLYAYKLFKVPPGMIVTKTGVATPGVCNATTRPQIEGLVEFLSGAHQTEVNDADLEVIRNAIGSAQSAVIQSVANSQKSAEEKDEDYKHFAYQKARGVVTRHYAPGESMLDKNYERTADELKAADAAKDGRFDYRIVDIADLDTDLLPIVAQGKNEVTTSELITWLYKAGYRHVYLYDLTCSIMWHPEEERIPDRDVRQLRRWLLDQKHFGGKPRKTRRKRTNVKRKERHYNGVSKARTRKVSRRQ